MRVERAKISNSRRVAQLIDATESILIDTDQGG